MRNLNTVYWKFSLQMFYRRLKIQYICFIACLLTSLIIKQMRKISLTRSALVTGCILISSIPLQGKAKNLYLEQGIQSFSGHARTDTRVTYKEKKSYTHTKWPYVTDSRTFVENDTLFFVQEYDREDGEMSRNTYIFLEPDRQNEYFQPDYWINRFEGNHEDYLQ